MKSEIRLKLLKGAAIVVASLSLSLPVNAKELELNDPGTLRDATSLLPGLMELDGDQPGGIFGNTFLEVAKRLNLDGKVDAYDFAALIPVLQSDRSDTIGPGLSITQPRAQVFYFAHPVLIQPETVAVRLGTTVNSWEQARDNGLTLSSITGYFQIGLWESMGIKVHAFDNVAACMLDVAKGGSDGCDVGAFDLAYFQLINPDSDAAKLDIVSVTGSSITTDMNSMAVSKSRPALARATRAAVTNMWRDGTMEDIWKAGVGESSYLNFISPPEGQAMYIPGPWESNVVPPASADFGEFETVATGTLTVGIVEDSVLLSMVSEGKLDGPEAQSSRR